MSWYSLHLCPLCFLTCTPTLVPLVSPIMIFHQALLTCHPSFFLLLLHLLFFLFSPPLPHPSPTSQCLRFYCSDLHRVKYNFSKYGSTHISLIDEEEQQGLPPLVFEQDQVDAEKTQQQEEEVQCVCVLVTHSVQVSVLVRYMCSDP